MMNFTFIGVKTSAYQYLVEYVQEVTQKHTIPANLKHINEVDEILKTNVESIPAIRVRPGNVVLHNPSNHHVESTILRLKPKNNLL